MQGERNQEEEEHRQAFGEPIPLSMQHKINRIKNNDPELKVLPQLTSVDFSKLACQLLGRYIAENDSLERISFDDPSLTDAKMILLFKYLTRSTSLKGLFLWNTNFRLKGIQSMVPFLKNSPNLKALTLSTRSINTECFELLISGLNGGSIKELEISSCSIDDISALGNYTLPHLKTLVLDRNNIQIISPLEKCPSLEKLWLEDNDIGDEAAEILAQSIKNNTTLKCLSLEYNDKIGEVGYRAFLKALNDVTSIDRTYNSNHTLIHLEFSRNWRFFAMLNSIKSALSTNRTNSENLHAAGRSKVIETQLRSSRRKFLSNLQGIEYSYNSIFAGVEPVLLPNILAITGGMYGLSELHCMLIATVPDLASIVNKKAAIKDRLAQIPIERAALDAEHLRLTNQLVLIESKEKNDSACVGTDVSFHGRKRRHSSANA